MRDGISGWKKNGYETVSKVELLNDLINVNKIDFAAHCVDQPTAAKLPNATFVDFRDKEKYDQGHLAEGNHVDYSDMFSKPMMEELNKSNSLIIIHDVPEVAGVIAATLKLMEYPDVYILKQ
ncbi:MAG: rhodanese-like domain-containing protein [Desulfobulbaceae bacterium]|nr:rhodanese-like domain-containing protein [Desulfobulbaceae bacterium]